MRFQSIVGGLAGALIVCSSATAAVVVDQSQPSSSVNLANVTATSHPVQSFQTSASNIAGGGFYLVYAAAEDSAPIGFEIALWDALPSIGNKLAFGTASVSNFNAIFVAPAQWVDVFWTPVSVLAGTTYYLSIDVTTGGTDSAGLGGEFHADPYTPGELFLRDAGSPNYLTYSSDTAFRTYADVTGGVPEPATWALMILGFGAAGSLLRRRRASGAAA